MSKPIHEKTAEIIVGGYDESAYAESYWLEPDVRGCRRIDRSAASLISLVERLREIKALPHNPRILDIGAGPGMVVHQFREAGFECEGCEFSESGRRIAKATFGIDLLYGDLRESLPYKDGEFDFAMCVGVMTMIPERSVLNAFREIRRVVATEGIVHLHLMNPNPAFIEPHITNLPVKKWWDLARKAELIDATSLWPPQREGIGVLNEFSGIFRA